MQDDPKGGSRRAPKPNEDGNWICPECKNVNYARREKCNLCHQPKPSGYSPPPMPISGTGRYNAAPAGSYIPGAAGPAAVYGYPQPPQPFDSSISAFGDSILHAFSSASYAQDRDPLDAAIEYLQSLKASRLVAQSRLGPGDLLGSSYGFEHGMKRGYSTSGPNGSGMLSGLSGGPIDTMISSDPSSKRARISITAGGPHPGVDGNWICVSCSNVNYARRPKCNKCGKDKPPEMSGADDGYGASYYYNQPPGLGGMEPPNGDARMGGHMLPMKRPVSPLDRNKKIPPREGEGGNWKCSDCQNVNFARRTTCNRCKKNKPEDQ
mmetsp:Transcript_42701/g.71033  ORF Transcript_42701/g.71033 Transcript_42701/m.71033 type:complete len:322 (+) Transcript_42701:140-1105(+)